MSSTKQYDKPNEGLTMPRRLSELNDERRNTTIRTRPDRNEHQQTDIAATITTSATKPTRHETKQPHSNERTTNAAATTQRITETSTWPGRPLFEWGGRGAARSRPESDRRNAATSRYKLEADANDSNDNSTEARNAERTKTLRL